MIEGRALDVLLLSYGIKNPVLMAELCRHVTSNYFDPSIQDFYQVVASNYKVYKDVLSPDALADYCESKGKEDQVERFSKIYNAAVNFKINEISPPESDFKYYLDKLKERYNNQVLIDTRTTLDKAIEAKLDCQSINKILEDGVKNVNKINSIEIFDEGSVGEDAENMFHEFEEISRDVSQFQGVMSGYPSLDELTNGFQPSELIIISAMEGAGKSVLMMNMSINAWLGSNKPGIHNFTDDGKNVLYFTLEMPRSNKGKVSTGGYLNKRILANVSGLPLNYIRKGDLTPEERNKLKESVNFIKEYDRKKRLYVVDIPRGARVEDIESKYLEINEQFPVDMIVIDYIGIMAGSNEDDSDWQAQGQIAAGLHELARTHTLPVLTATQVNRPSGTQSLDGQKYNTNRVARSAMISQNANIVLQIGVRDEEYKQSDMPIYITKMRDGEKKELSFIKDLARMRIYDATEESASQPTFLDNDLNFDELEAQFAKTKSSQKTTTDKSTAKDAGAYFEEEFNGTTGIPAENRISCEA